MKDRKKMVLYFNPPIILLINNYTTRLNDDDSIWKSGSGMRPTSRKVDEILLSHIN